MFDEVSSEIFYKKIGIEDVILEVVEPFPYKVLFKRRRTDSVVGYEDRDGKYYIKNLKED